MRVFLLLILTTLLPTSSAFTQQPHQTRVAVEVTADEVIKSQIVSQVNAGLRRLGDVVVVSNDSTLHISLVFIKSSVIDGQTLGYAVSIVVTKSEWNEASRRAMVNVTAKDESSAQLLNEMFGDGVTLIYHSMLTGGPNLEELCKRVVAELDADPIESERKYWQDIADHTKKFLDLKKKYPNKSYRELEDIIDSEKKKPK